MHGSRNAGDFFDRFAGTFDTFYDGKRNMMMQWFDRHWRRDMFVRYALTFERLGDLTGQRGLDVGCGSGPYVAEAIKRGASHVVGVDPAPGMLGLARARMQELGALDRVTLIEGYFPDRAPPGPFDFAIVMGVLDYVSNPLAFFQGLRRIVSGKAAVSFPSKHWFRTPVRKFRYKMRNCPVFLYDERDIRSLARDASFGSIDVIKIDGAGMDYHVCLAP